MHNNIEGRPVGKHLEVSSLITGVFSDRPPHPKYNFIWDIQSALDYRKKELPKNSSLSDKLMTFKVAMLLALMSSSRVRNIRILDTRFMVKDLQKYVFKFHKLHISWRQGQKPTSLEFAAFSQNKDLCAVSALDEYLNRTEEWRRVNTRKYSKIFWYLMFDYSQLIPHVQPQLQKQVLLVYQTWSNKSAWQMFYKKDIIPIRVENSQHSVMGGT